MSTSITWSSLDGVLDDCDVINVTFEQGAVPPSTVEFVLQSDVPAWKALAFDDNVIGGSRWEISTQGTQKSSGKTVDATTVTDKTTIEFRKARSFGLNAGAYVLRGLPDKIRPGMRIRFHWVRDTCGGDGTVAASSRTDAPGNPAINAVTGAAGDAIAGVGRLLHLLTGLEKLLSEKYAFDVFARNSINFGILITYRQKWVPGNYQVGDLVSTIPLAPKEVRRYTTRTVTKKNTGRQGS